MSRILCLLHYTSSVGLHRVFPGFSSEIDEKLIEFLIKYEELYDMSNKKYSDNAWKEILCGPIGEELKKSRKLQCSFVCIFFEYYRLN
jgi:hypothetical protein